MVIQMAKHENENIENKNIEEETAEEEKLKSITEQLKELKAEAREIKQEYTFIGVYKRFRKQTVSIFHMKQTKEKEKLLKLKEVCEETLNRIEKIMEIKYSDNE